MSQDQTDARLDGSGELEQHEQASDAQHPDPAEHMENLKSIQETQEGILAELTDKLTCANSLRNSAQQFLGDLTKIVDAISADRESLEHEKTLLVARKHSLRKAEAERDAGYADERAAVDSELLARRRAQLRALEGEIDELKSAGSAEVAEAETAERERIRVGIDKDRAIWDEVREEQQQGLKRQQDELQMQKGAVSALQSALVGRRAELESNELDLEQRSDRIKGRMQRRSEKLDEEVEEKMAEGRKSFESTLRAAAAEGDRLRETIRSQTDVLGTYEHLQQQLGGRDPGAVILELNTLRDQVKRQTEELATRPTEEMRSKFNALEADKTSLQNRIDELDRRLRDNDTLASQSSDFKHTNIALNAQNKSLEQSARIFEAAANQAEVELNRLRAAYERPAEIESRYREIELPAIKAAKITPPRLVVTDEVEWLNGIAAASENYGLHFNPRILKAFHTALKTAEWSPLTVLAGVSGTGKSELPRLYSHFGGLFFEPLAVQPNWDSQESMLGFFNSIDNRFDAQLVLRFLAQSQKPWTAHSDDNEGYPGLADAMCLVLLDEMNLAHPELYFAEFLSKLELRRGRKGPDVPSLPVKIGAGMEPYHLPLGRNVLWAGTMNQDETTKSLSDKVLDRSIIIHFPRPTDLKSRLKLVALDENNRGAILHKDSWQSWIARGSGFTEEEVRPYKAFIEDLNTSLAVAGRGFGHRVWQSVEYYMANYPDVRAAGDDSTKKARAMHVAFEDQLVQKVMPKLRGIDTRGKSKDECLDKIRGQLVAGIGGNGFNLAEDFDLATELGYGQFIWQSANYLRGDNTDESA